MDCAVIPSKRHRGFVTVSTCDFFYPNVESPFVQGQIAAANVLSDMYAMGVTDIDSVLMILAASLDMDERTRMIVARQFILGFDATTVRAAVAEHPSRQASLLAGGQSILNPWPIIGGCASSICTEDEMIMPVNAVAGDVLVLTKPLGTQLAVNVKQWSHTPDDVKFTRLSALNPPMSRYDVLYAFHSAQDNMVRLNVEASRLMHKYCAHAATDVTGFGYLGHADALVKNQVNAVDFELHTMPVIRRMMEVSDLANFSLRRGLSPETSGGLLVAISADSVDAFCADLKAVSGHDSWIVGRVVPGTRTARLTDSPRIIDV